MGVLHADGGSFFAGGTLVSWAECPARICKDHGVSGAKDRNGRRAFDALCRDASKRQFDVVMARNVNRLGRSLKDLVALLSEADTFASRSLDLSLREFPQSWARPPAALRAP